MVESRLTTEIMSPFLGGASLIIGDLNFIGSTIWESKVFLDAGWKQPAPAFHVDQMWVSALVAPHTVIGPAVFDKGGSDHFAVFFRVGIP